MTYLLQFSRKIFSTGLALSFFVCISLLSGCANNEPKQTTIDQPANLNTTPAGDNNASMPTGGGPTDDTTGTGRAGFGGNTTGNK
jgi:hypothetical protein